MSAKREYLDFMSDIVRTMSQAERIVSGVTFDELIQNEEKVLAATKAVENIGEAVKNIPADVRARYPEIDLKKMAGMRDRMTHGYFAVDLPILCGDRFLSPVAMYSAQVSPCQCHSAANEDRRPAGGGQPCGSRHLPLGIFAVLPGFQALVAQTVNGNTNSISAHC
ncbi:MAG TPA: HepT-like ribonuclease domain-containing protein [Anaerolineae bacterium]|nr:HepT-like ribonuclease domain-containing protein [Anaerolineae bacterium]